MNDPVNKVNEVKKYEFKLLRGEAVGEDAFEDKTHEKIADSLAQLIKNEEKGITIGLEGSWGSGKSTVISILRKKLKEGRSSIPLIQFDAWAHEGDPLRRIFLESLIDEISSVYNLMTDSLKEKKEEISKHRVVKNINTKQATTIFGTFFALSFALIPLGISLIDKTDFSKLSTSGNLYLIFIIGIIFTALPILPIFINFIYLLKKEKLKLKNVFTLKNWAFLQKNSQNTISQESTEEDERTSIEFEKDFNIIVQEIIVSHKIDKLILVIDNLDRIDAKDSLRIWATLQTFLQQRNQPDQKDRWFDKVWVIVPYDSDGLASLWDSDNDEEDEDKKCNTSKSFFDKCFQLRLEVPKPVFTGWEAFARNLMKESLINWDDEDKEELIRVLRLTRKNLNDIPTPREIKNYINQVGFTASLRGNEIAISSIAYYVIWRELYNASVDTIRSELLKNVLLNGHNNHEIMLNPSLKKDLSALIFGVSPDKGFQLLLLPEITGSLQKGDGAYLKLLCEKHTEGFWLIFKYYVENNDFDISKAMRGAQAILEGLWDVYYKECQIFIKRVETINFIKDNSTEYFWSEELLWNEESNFKKYFSLLKISKERKSFIIKLYEFLIWNLENYIRNHQTLNKPTVIVENLQTVIIFLNNIDYKPLCYEIQELHLIKFLQLCNVKIQKDFNILSYIKPSKSIMEEISKSILPGQVIQDGLSIVIYNLLDIDFEGNWDIVINKGKAYIEWNSGQYSNQSDDIFKIINALAFKLQDSEEQIKKILLLGQYHNLFWFRKEQNLINVAIVTGYLFGNTIHAMNISHVGNSAAGYEVIKSFWRTSSISNAELIINEMKMYNERSFIWELIEESSNKLVGDIVTISIEDPSAIELFNVTNCLEKLSYYRAMLGDQLNKKKLISLIRLFIEKSSLEMELVVNDNLDIIKYKYELFFIIDYVNNEVIDKISKLLKIIKKDDWYSSFNNDTYLTSCALKIKEKKSDLYLENDYFDALVEFSIKLDEDEELSKWQTSNWDNLILLMNGNFQKIYRKKITEYIIEKKFKVSLAFYDPNEKYIVVSDIIKNNELLQNSFEILVKEKDFEHLQILNQIISASKARFKPEDYFIEFIKKPLNDLYNELDDNMENENLIKSLAEIFRVTLIKEKKIGIDNTPSPDAEVVK